MRLKINGWSVSDPKANETECPKNLTKIIFFLNNSSNIMLNVTTQIDKINSSSAA